ncbi:long-chain fatty acid--CoA ligase [Lapillicoccus jejuensis]|uniref:Fatty-acyl-CoA synthase n=1 Tax=Lapillicoccus jejuensis TaxID=402171 RepID=A0A542DXY1_9MICO|nr:long-chain fatty acid--CoA ligase [Lapillicoccus jejuensis]TQJ07952.1 fatty-acyl-CoA synthase [Lapillicoccus jejuensis]
MKSTMQSTPLLISQLLRYGTTVHADQEVITWTPEGGRRMSYGEVGRKAAQLAHALRGIGITGDQRVATFMWNNAEHLISYLAIPSMGAVLHALNIRLFPEQLIYTATHAGNEAVIVDNTLAAPFAKLLAHLPKIHHVVVNGPIDDETRAALEAPEHVQAVVDFEEFVGGQPTTFDWPDDLDEDSASSMCYTSGTTGNPKGVVYSHRSNYLHAITDAMTLGVREGDRNLVVVPLFHANAWGFPYIVMLAGSSMIMPDRFLQAEPLARMIDELEVTTGAGVPTIWSELLRHLDAHPEIDSSACYRLMVGGSAAPPAMIRAYQERHGIEIIHGWGMTETSPVGSLAVPPARCEVGSEEYWSYREKQGRLLVGFQGRLMGPDGSQQPWDGEAVGELEVRGPWVTGSYYMNGTESETDKAEMAAKFSPDGWLRTGDVGLLTPDGFLQLTDRAKDVIKSGGEWISSVDLENAIMAHPKVREASVIGVPDDKWQERPLATVVPEEGAEVTAEELRDFLAEKVAKWQVPERWAFIPEVPKTSVGKFDKKVLRKQYADGGLEVTHF